MIDADNRIDLTEMNKLKMMLEDNNIPFVETKIDNVWFHNYQICYPDMNVVKSDVVIGIGTYGYKDGLLEQMGLIGDDCLEDDVQGWLDAETVFERWYEDFYGHPYVKNDSSKS